MPSRREFFHRVVAGAASAALVSRHGLERLTAASQGQSARRQVMVGGRRLKVMDVHAHCVIPVQEVVKDTPLAKMRSGGGNNILGPQRLQVMDQQGVDVQALSIVAPDGLCYWFGERQKGEGLP